MTAPGIPFRPLPDGSWVLQDPDGPTVLRFTAAEFAAFVDGCRRGEFDHLCREEVRDG